MKTETAVEMWNAGTEKPNTGNTGGWESQCFANTTRIHTRRISVSLFSRYMEIMECGVVCFYSNLLSLLCWVLKPCVRFFFFTNFFFWQLFVGWSQTTFPPGVKIWIFFFFFPLNRANKTNSASIVFPLTFSLELYVMWRTGSITHPSFFLQDNLDTREKKIKKKSSLVIRAESVQYRCFSLIIKSDYCSLETCQHISSNLCLSCYQCFYIRDFKATDVSHWFPQK